MNNHHKKFYHYINRINDIALRSWRKFISSLQWTFNNSSKIVYIFIVVLFTSIFFNEIGRETIIVDPIEVPRAIADNGFTSIIIAKHIHDKIQYIYDEAGSLRNPKDFAPLTELPKIEIPGSGLPIPEIVGYIKELFGIPITKISGEIVQEENGFKFRLRIIEGRFAKFYDLESSENFLDDRCYNTLDCLIFDAAYTFLEQNDPFIVASYLFKRDIIASRRMAYRAIALGNEKNIAWAKNLIGLTYHELGDYEEAISWFQEADELGSAVARMNIGLLYQNGFGVEQNFQEALYWYDKAAKLGNAAALTNIGLLNKEGKGLEINYNSALSYFKKAAELGNPAAYTNIGLLYEEGNGVEQNYQTALIHYQKAAEMGSATAHANIGDLYENGNGVEKDSRLASAWYKRAYELDNNQDPYRERQDRNDRPVPKRSSGPQSF